MCCFFFFLGFVERERERDKKKKKSDEKEESVIVLQRVTSRFEPHVRSIGAFFVWTQNSLKQNKNFFYFFCVLRERVFRLSLSLSLSLFFLFFCGHTYSRLLCVFETNHNVIITRSAQKQHHHLRFFVVRDERSNNSIFGVCAEKKTRASGFGVFFMSFRAATGVRFDSSVVLSSASRHHRHRLGARLVRFLLRLRFPSYERKKERKRKRAPAKRTTGVAGLETIIDFVRGGKKSSRRAFCINREAASKERDLSSNVRNQSSSSFGLFFFFFFFFFSLLKLVVVVFYVVVEKKGRRRW